MHDFLRLSALVGVTLGTLVLAAGCCGRVVVDQDQSAAGAGGGGGAGGGPGTGGETCAGPGFERTFVAPGLGALDIAAGDDCSFAMATFGWGRFDLGEGAPDGQDGGAAMVLARYSPDGDLERTKAFSGGAYLYTGDHLRIDADGAVVLGGQIDGTIDFGGGPLVGAEGDLGVGLFVAKLDRQLGHVWSRRFSGSNSGSSSFAPGREVHGLALGPDGSVVLTGYYEGGIDFGAGEMIAKDNDDGFVAKLAPDGSLRWAHSFGGPLDDVGEDVEVTADGDVVLLGRCGSSASFLGQDIDSPSLCVARLDGEGAVRWVRPFDAPGNHHGGHLALFADGRIALTVTTRDEVNIGGLPPPAEPGALHAIVAVLSPDGEELRAMTIEGASLVQGFAATADGTVHVTGFFESVLSVSGEVVAEGVDDGFHLTLTGDLVVVAMETYGKPGSFDGIHEVTVDRGGRLLLAGAGLPEDSDEGTAFIRRP